MARLFGTDGIRGKANHSPVDPVTALALGKATVAVLGLEDASPTVIIGQDTRQSCDMLVCALAAGVSSMGAEVRLAGVIPTPGVAFLTRTTTALAGIVVSASHNPYEDNGIKLFDGGGFKLSDGKEAAIEKWVLEERGGKRRKDPIKVGRVRPMTDGESRYASFLKKSVAPSRFLEGIKIVMDCANGATYRVAPGLFKDLGAEVHPLFVMPDGRNINRNCGSQHVDTLRESVVAARADIGLAFDGDGDRLIAVDETGRLMTGDRILAICANDLNQKARLKNRVVVSTVMSNIGLGLALEQMGIRWVAADVGDRRVMERMVAEGAVLGGEDSGHVIFLDRHTTGDGIFTSLRLLTAMTGAGRPLSRLARMVTVFPQELVNVDVREKPDLKTVPEITAAIRSAERRLGKEGRVLVRYSGTEQKCRVMVEGPTREETRRLCSQIAAIVRERLG